MSALMSLGQMDKTWKTERHPEFSLNSSIWYHHDRNNHELASGLTARCLNKDKELGLRRIKVLRRQLDQAVGIKNEKILNKQLTPNCQQLPAASS